MGKRRKQRSEGDIPVDEKDVLLPSFSHDSDEDVQLYVERIGAGQPVHHAAQKRRKKSKPLPEHVTDHDASSNGRLQPASVEGPLQPQLEQQQAATPNAAIVRQSPGPSFLEALQQRMSERRAARATSSPARAPPQPDNSARHLAHQLESTAGSPSASSGHSGMSYGTSEHIQRSAGRSGKHYHLETTNSKPHHVDTSASAQVQQPMEVLHPPVAAAAEGQEKGAEAQQQQQLLVPTATTQPLAGQSAFSCHPEPTLAERLDKRKHTKQKQGSTVDAIRHHPPELGGTTLATATGKAALGMGQPAPQQSKVQLPPGAEMQPHSTPMAAVVAEVQQADVQVPAAAPRPSTSQYPGASSSTGLSFEAPTSSCSNHSPGLAGTGPGPPPAAAVVVVGDSEPVRCAPSTSHPGLATAPTQPQPGSATPQHHSAASTAPASQPASAPASPMPMANPSPFPSPGAAAAVNPRIALWEPPASPFSLLEEVLYDDPWRLLLACILLNKTTATQVRKVLPHLLSRYPTPQDLAAVPVPPKVPRTRRTTVTAAAAAAVTPALSRPGSTRPARSSQRLPGTGGQDAGRSSSSTSLSGGVPHGATIGGEGGTTSGLSDDEANGGVQGRVKRNRTALALPAAYGTVPVFDAVAVTEVGPCQELREAPATLTTVSRQGSASIVATAAAASAQPQSPWALLQARAAGGSRTAGNPGTALATSPMDSTITGAQTDVPSGTAPVPTHGRGAVSKASGSGRKAGPIKQESLRRRAAANRAAKGLRAARSGQATTEEGSALDTLQMTVKSQRSSDLGQGQQEGLRPDEAALAAAAAAVPPELSELQALLRPLGFAPTRSVKVVQFSRDYVNKAWSDPRELHGIGQYGADAYFMFCRGRWRDVHPQDKDLKRYRDWLSSTGGLGQGLERESRDAVLTPHHHE